MVTVPTPLPLLPAGSTALTVTGLSPLASLATVSSGNVQVPSPLLVAG